MDQDQFPKITAVKPGDPFRPPIELSDGEIAEIHSGLLLPNREAIHSMAREIRKWRGVQDPDAI